MKIKITGKAFLFFAAAMLSCTVITCPAEGKLYKLFVVSSYHSQYLWSQDTQKGLCAGLIKYGFMDSNEQAAAFTKNDYVETSTVVIKKAWMDTKHKDTTGEIAQTTTKIVNEIKQFAPDLIFLGDDNAANYIGNQFVDTNIPIVFWGINGMPVKYGLLDSIERPGHNVTGVYQEGYPKECLEFLKRVVPGANSFAILSDDSETGRTKVKQLENLARTGQLPLRLQAVVITNSLPQWKSKALELQDKVDAFFVVNHNTIRDVNDQPVDQLEIGAWYLRNIKKPECGDEKQFAQEGMLCTCDDSGFNQAFEAVKMADRILRKKESPANIPVYMPQRGPFIINRQRAKMLGISITDKMQVEEYIDTALALEKYPLNQKIQ
jgi:ABC-type uncharacterized transport system substrate-binding protein